MKKVVIVIVVVLLVAVGAYAIFHKPKNSNSSTTSQNNAPTVNNAVLITKTNSSVGQYLADPSGKTLYTYNADTNGASNCTGSCLQAWPAYVDKGSTSGLPTGVSTIKRTDNGQMQFTYNGLPLYYFVGDSTGQVTGNGVQNFTVAKPAASTQASATSNSTNTTPPPASSTSNSYNY